MNANFSLGKSRLTRQTKGEVSKTQHCNKTHNTTTKTHNTTTETYFTTTKATTL